MEEDTKNKSEKTWLSYLITFGVSAVCWFIVLLIMGVFSAKDAAEQEKILSNASILVGVILTGYGLLVLVSNGGAFDMLAYGFRSAIYLLFPFYRKDKHHQSYYEYHLEKQGNGKKSFWHLVFVGIFFIILSAIFAAVYTRIA